MSDNKDIPVVVPAAGVGSRMGADRPKQYLPLNHKTVLEQTLSVLHQHPRIGQIYLALDPQDPYFEELPLSKASWITRVDGGHTRAESVLAGLAAIQSATWVMVHDAARPCLQHSDIDRLLDEVMQYQQGAILASKVKDTMKQAQPESPNQVLHTASRDNLWHAQTPQCFAIDSLYPALKDALDQAVDITDEASAIEWAGGPVRLVEGSDQNIKITRPDDLALAAYFISNRSD